jgi:hypothetical protein
MSTFQRHLPGSLPDPGGADSVSKAHRRQQQVANLYTRWRGSFPDGIDLDKLKDAAGQFAYTDAAVQVPEVIAAVTADAAAAAEKREDPVKGTTVDGDVASHNTAQRYWDRTQRTLGSIKGPEQPTDSGPGPREKRH